MTLTLDQLRHLCSLTALQLDEAQLTTLLPQLATIIDFAGQLELFALEKNGPILGNNHTTSTAQTTSSTIEDTTFTDAFLANIRHTIIRQMPVLETSLNKE